MPAFFVYKKMDLKKRLEHYFSFLIEIRKS